MDLAWLKDFGGFIKDLATVILPIIGVVVGAKLAGRTADDQWLKKERLTAYVDLLDQLSVMLKQFAVGMKVSKFGHHVESEHHNSDTVDAAWQSQMDELTRAELKVRILGGKLGAVYEDQADNLIGEMLDAIDDPDITPGEWNALTDRGFTLEKALESSAKADLEVPVKRNSKWFIRK